MNSSELARPELKGSHGGATQEWREQEVVPGAHHHHVILRLVYVLQHGVAGPPCAQNHQLLSPTGDRSLGCGEHPGNSLGQ